MLLQQIKFYNVIKFNHDFLKDPFRIKRHALVVVTPVRYQILIRFRSEISVQFLTQVTKWITPHVLLTGCYPVVILPPKIFAVQRIVGVEEFQVCGQFFRLELPSVDVGMGRSVPIVVGATIHNRNNVSIHHGKKRFRHVIRTKWIFKRQVKLVVAHQNVVTLRSVTS